MRADQYKRPQETKQLVRGLDWIGLVSVWARACTFVTVFQCVQVGEDV